MLLPWIALLLVLLVAVAALGYGVFERAHNAHDRYGAWRTKQPR